MVMEYIEFRDKLQSNIELEMEGGMVAVMKRTPAGVGRGRCLLPSFFLGLALLSMVELLQWRCGGRR